MIVPTMATIVVGTSGLIDHIEEAQDADQARTIAQLEQYSGELVDSLQNERAAAARFLSTPNSQRDAKPRCWRRSTRRTPWSTPRRRTTRSSAR